MGSLVPALPLEAWRETCDTLHAHTQVLGKIALALAPAEPRLQQAALRLTARGWETSTLPAPDGSGSVIVALDLRSHEAVAEHSAGHERRLPLAPDRVVGEVTRELIDAVTDMAGAFSFNAAPQEVPWTAPLDEDTEHRTYNATQVSDYFDAATCVALALAAFRAPWTGPCTPVNAWWGSFDIAVNLFRQSHGGVQELAVGWWPGDERHPSPALYAYASPVPDGFGGDALDSTGAVWDAELGEHLLEWALVAESADPAAKVLGFARAALERAAATYDWKLPVG